MGALLDLARFRTTSNFDREYLRNGSRCRKSERYSINSVWQKSLVNFGPLKTMFSKCER